MSQIGSVLSTKKFGEELHFLCLSYSSIYFLYHYYRKLDNIY